MSLGLEKINIWLFLFYKKKSVKLIKDRNNCSNKSNYSQYSDSTDSN